MRNDEPERIGILLIPQFSMMAFCSAVEPLRVANRLAGRTLFAWRACSVDGEPVAASNGMRVMVSGRPGDTDRPETLFICAGFEPERYATKSLLAVLRRLARAGVTLGALDTGAYFLAKARLLDGLRVTTHWEAVAALREAFPEIEVSDNLFEIDDRRITCAGGTAALDMMLDIIGRGHGHALAIAVSEQFIHDRIRDRHAHQRMELSSRLRVTSAHVLNIVAAMERNLEQPLNAGQLAAECAISPRQMERLFRRHLQVSPASYYAALRLARARQLLRQTRMGVLDIAMACGFASSSSFSRSYRGQFGVAPSQDRLEPAV
ncbi:MAG TPA: GlxA family transcriptional regulator [Stellaceae bacterium]|nr:GlxA family transcriptional regulator [Stellaceae bacterium]